ncbi:MAG: hypothetical protein WD005_01985 [Haliea sp.]
MRDLLVVLGWIAVGSTEKIEGFLFELDTLMTKPLDGQLLVN